MFLREGTRVFLDFEYAHNFDASHLMIPDQAFQGTVLYLAGKVVRLVLSSWDQFELGENAVLLRKVKHGIFGAPIVLEDIAGPSTKTIGVRLLNPGAVLQRRDTVRVQTALDAAVFHIKDEKAVKNFTAVVVDISQGGIRLKSNENLKLGDELRVTLTLDEETVTFHAVVRSVVPCGSYGVETMKVPPEVARKVRKFIVSAQISQNPRLNEEMHEQVQSEEVDEYWNMVSDGSQDSVAVLTDPLDFQKIVFGAFDPKP